MRHQPVILIFKRTILLLVLGAAILAWMVIGPWLGKAEHGYQALSELPHDFVIATQALEKDTGTPWQLSAAYSQLSIEKEIIDSYPSLEQMQPLALNLAKLPEKKWLSTFSDESGGIFSSKELNTRYKLLLSAAPLFSTDYLFPLPQDTVEYADTWHAERDNGKRQHQGTDIFAPEGTPVFAVTHGMIERQGNERLGGERIGLRGRDGLYYYYAHLAGYAPDLKEGKLIQKGELLGYVGHTGNAQGTPDHLHFGIMTPNGKWFNPYNFLKYWEEESN